MNKTIAVLASLAVLGGAAKCTAAAVVNLNNYDANVPILYKATGSSTAVNAPAATTYVELLGGATGGALSPVTINATAGSIINPLGEDGFFDNGVGVVPGLTDKASADFVLRAWTGAATYAEATIKGESARWTQATGSWNTTSSPPGTPDNIALNIPASGVTIQAGTPIVPEPSTIALGLLGAAALLLRRRQ